MIHYLGQTLPDTWKHIDWEAHADIRNLPAEDLYGIHGFGAIADEGTDTLAFTIALSSHDDKNLFRMRKAAAMLYELWRKPGLAIPMFDPDSTEKIGVLVVTDGTVLAPVGRAELRPYQTVNVHVKTALNDPAGT